MSNQIKSEETFGLRVHGLTTQDTSVYNRFVGEGANGVFGSANRPINTLFLRNVIQEVPNAKITRHTSPLTDPCLSSR